VATDRQKLTARLKKYSEKDHKTRCRNWTGAVDNNGYGRIKVDGKAKRAHRVAYQTYIGDIPNNMPVHHTCANSTCINVNHLQLVTQRENIAEMQERNYYIKRIEELEERLAQYERKKIPKANTDSAV